MENKIVCLTGADRVRRRPAVIFGSEGAEGVMCALEMLLGLMASECQKGYATELTLTQYADGSLEIQDNGRGLYLGSGKPEDDHIWKERLCELFCCSAQLQPNPSHEFSYFDPTGQVPCRDYDGEPYWEFDLCAVQYATEWMDVTVCRDGLEFYLHFEKGENIGGLSVKASGAPTGTKIRLKPDKAVFTCITLPEDFLPKQLRKLALLVPSCQFHYRKEHSTHTENETFCFPEGIAGGLPAGKPVFTTEIAARGKDRYNRPEYGAKIRVALCFSRDVGYVQSFHNLQTLPLGGHHVTKLTDKIAKHLQWQLGNAVDFQLIRRHLCLVVHTTTSGGIANWGDGTRTWIQNPMITDMAEDCINDNFSYFVKCHRREIGEIFGILA